MHGDVHIAERRLFIPAQTAEQVGKNDPRILFQGIRERFANADPSRLVEDVHRGAWCFEYRLRGGWKSEVPFTSQTAKD
jgi:hypothetical protein